MIQILHFSDCHLFADPTKELSGVRTADSLASVLTATQKQASKSQLAIITGDLTQDGETGAYRLAEHMFSSLNIPVYAVPGNHDPSDLMRKSLTGHPIVWKRSVVVKGWHIVLLNSAQPNKVEGWFSETELSKLEETLTEKPNMPTLVCHHHQPVPVEMPWMDPMGLVKPEPFLRILGRYPLVRCVLFGHIHRPFEARWKGIHLFSAPSTCIQFAKGTEHPVCTTDAPGCRWLKLYPDGQLETDIIVAIHTPQRGLK